MLTLLALVSLATGGLKAVTVMILMIVLSVGLRFWLEMESVVQAESLRQLVRSTAIPILSTISPPTSPPGTWCPATR